VVGGRSFVHFPKAKQRSLITEPHLAFSFSKAYWLCSTMYIIHRPRYYTILAMWYSEKEYDTQHQMMRMKSFQISTSTEISLRIPNPPLQSQPEIKLRCNLMTSHHWSIWSIGSNYETLLAVNGHLQMHGSHWLEKDIKTIIERWQGLHNSLLRTRNSMISFPSMLSQLCPMITRMKPIIRSCTSLPLILRSLIIGTWPWTRCYLQLDTIRGFEWGGA